VGACQISGMRLTIAALIPKIPGPGKKIEGMFGAKEFKT